MSNESIGRAYTLLRDCADGEEPYNGMVAAMSRALERHDAKLLQRILVPFENLLASIADRAQEARSAAQQEVLNQDYMVLAKAIQDAKLLSTGQPPKLREE